MNSPYTHLEDFSEDIIAKAQNGLRLTNRVLAERAGIDLGRVKALKNGEPDEAALRAIASVLHLDPESLATAARKQWLPRPQELPGGTLFTSRFRSMKVNAFLFASGGEAVLFDTGVDPEPILTHLRREGLALKAVVLTHGHPDHIAALEPILREAGDCSVFAHPWEQIAGAFPVEWGSPFTAGPFTLSPLPTPGHTPGGTSFQIQGMVPRVCIVGDALFAGSVGGCAADYDRALSAIRENIFSLPNETILCPGHGPVTTVEEEKAHNPFFALSSECAENWIVTT